MNPVFP